MNLNAAYATQMGSNPDGVCPMCVVQLCTEGRDQFGFERVILDSKAWEGRVF